MIKKLKYGAHRVGLYVWFFVVVVVACVVLFIFCVMLLFVLDFVFRFDFFPLHILLIYSFLNSFYFKVFFLCDFTQQ